MNVNLSTTGSLAVLGDPLRGRAVVRGMLTSLAITHSPSDVHLWLFADSHTSSEWGPVRWLPHAMIDDETCRIASSAVDRSTLLVRLRQEIDRRRELRATYRESINLPIHVVVVDGADLLSAGDLSDILMRGPELGVVGIVVDSAVPPDGTMGTLTIGAAADEGVFESRHQPRISDLLTAEMPADAMERAARRLAGLRPPQASTGLGANQRLFDLVDAAGIGGAALAERWRMTSKQTRVLVGSAIDAPFFVDVVRDGPHGLVGGMTRSGKTEFLKTLITSLAWHNHPDDLCFVVVDFKGGIDYTLAADLPHVLEVSSNRDIGGFERTVRLLGAELRRRQFEFERARVANLDAYCAARSADPSLAPIPRVVVLIDEFGELRSSEVGMEHLRQLESMARIGGGLGVHLLLITQNFEGQLPGQVDANAGLRVCFRVEDPSHSRIVIGSGIASEIPASAKGRGYARLQGRDPVEFQTARVAGRRRELEAALTPASVRLQPFEMLPVAFSADVPLDVRAQDTDMAAMIDVIADAAKAAGWVRPAIPWPAPLPTDVALEAVVSTARPTSVAVGLADLPDEQQQEPYHLHFAAGHVALLGGPSADLTTAMIAIAASAAVSHSVDDLHIYAIDFAGRGLARIGALPHCGGVANRNDPLAGRIARFLADEASERRSRLASARVSTIEEYEARTGETFPHVLLLIGGAERLSSIASHDEPSVATGPTTSLIVDAVGLGIQVIAAGLPAFASYRPGSYIEHRLVFATADPAEYLSLGCPRALLGEVKGLRRGIDVNAQTLVQLASLAAGETSEADGFDALAFRLHERWSEAEIRRLPRRFREVVWPLSLDALRDGIASLHPTGDRAIPIGVDSTGGDVLLFDPDKTSRSLFVAGPRGSGRSNALAAFGLLAIEAGWRVIAVACGPDSPLAPGAWPFESVGPSDVDEHLERKSRRTLVLVDDADSLGELPPEQHPSRLDIADAVVFAGPAAAFAGVQRMITRTGADRARVGLTLRPSRYEDVEPIGASADELGRLSRDQRAGQGLFGDGRMVVPITVPLVERKESRR